MGYDSPEPDGLLRPQDVLEGDAIIPGFSMSVAELFEEWDFSRSLICHLSFVVCHLLLVICTKDVRIPSTLVVG